MKVILKIVIKSINCIIYKLDTSDHMLWPHRTFRSEILPGSGIQSWPERRWIDRHEWWMANHVPLRDNHFYPGGQNKIQHPLWISTDTEFTIWISLNISENMYISVHFSIHLHTKPAHSPCMALHSIVLKRYLGLSRWRILTDDTSWEGGSCSMPLLGVWSLGALVTALVNRLVVMETDLDKRRPTRIGRDCLVCKGSLDDIFDVYLHMHEPRVFI